MINNYKTLIIIILIISLFYLSKSKKGYTLKRVRSDIDNNMYTVRDVEDSQKAANMLSRIRKNMLILRDHLVENSDSQYANMKPYIDNLDRRIEGVIFSESDGSNKYTSYSVNKGEQIVFCLRSTKQFIKQQGDIQVGKIHDINLVMYVALHEIAHVACPEYGHTPLFKDIFAFFTKVASTIGIYKIIEFNTNTEEYCGLLISDSII